MKYCEREIHFDWHCDYPEGHYELPTFEEYPYPEDLVEMNPADFGITEESEPDIRWNE